MLASIVWSLLVVVTAVNCTVVSDSCNTQSRSLHIARCGEVHGFPILCTNEVLEHIIILRQLDNLLESFYSNSASRDYSVYSEYELHHSTSVQWDVAIRNFYDFLNKTFGTGKYISSETCIHIWPPEDETVSTELNPYFLLIDFYFPILGSIELILGIVGNLMVVAIYIRDRDLKTGPHIMVVNLAVGDMFHLIINIAVYYSIHRWSTYNTAETLCQFIPYLKVVSAAVSIYSMVGLSVIRYLAMLFPTRSRTHHFMPPVFVWILAVVTGIPEYMSPSTTLCGFRHGKVAIYTRLCCLCVLPLAVITASYTATSRIIRRSEQQLPDDQTLEMQSTRKRDATLIVCLAVVFSITYLPFNAFDVHHYYLNEYYYLNSHFYYWFIAQLLTPLNSYLNPLALLIGSSQFRQDFKRCFAKCLGKQTTNVARVDRGLELRTKGSLSLPQKSTSNLA